MGDWLFVVGLGLWVAVICCGGCGFRGWWWVFFVDCGGLWGGLRGYGLQWLWVLWLGWVFFVDCGGLRWVAGVGCGVMGCGGCGLVCDWVAVVVGFVVGGGFFLLIVVGSGVVGCGGCGLVCDWVAVVVGFVVGGGLRWVAGVGCGVGLGGWQGWVCFTLLQTHNVEYFLEHFPRVQTNIGKTNIFP